MLGLDKVKIPESFVVTTGGEEELRISERRDRFFGAIRASIGMAAVQWDTLFRVKEYQLYYSDSHPSDDRIHELTWGGEVPLGQVRDVRDDFNRHLILFTVFSELPAEVVDQIEIVRNRGLSSEEV